MTVSSNSLTHESVAKAKQNAPFYPGCACARGLNKLESLLDCASIRRLLEDVDHFIFLFGFIDKWNVASVVF